MSTHLESQRREHYFLYLDLKPLRSNTFQVFLELMSEALWRRSFKEIWSACEWEILAISLDTCDYSVWNISYIHMNCLHVKGVISHLNSINFHISKAMVIPLKTDIISLRIEWQTLIKSNGQRVNLVKMLLSAVFSPIFKWNQTYHIIIGVWNADVFHTEFYADGL